MRKTHVLVVSETEKLDRAKQLAALNCQECENTTVVQASLAAENPHCSHCGSDKVVPTEHSSLVARSLLRADDDEQASVRCPGCSCFTIMTASQAQDSDDGNGIGHIHCVACAKEMTFHVPSPAETASDGDEDWDEGDTGMSADEDSQPSISVSVYDGEDNLVAEGELLDRDGLLFTVSTEDDGSKVYSVGSEDDVTEDEGMITLKSAEVVDESSPADMEDDNEDMAGEEASTTGLSDPLDEKLVPVPDKVVASDGEPQGLDPALIPTPSDPAQVIEDLKGMQPASNVEVPSDPDTPPVTDLAEEPVAQTPLPEPEMVQVSAQPVTVPLVQFDQTAQPVFASYGGITVCRQGDLIVAHVEGDEGPSFATALNKALEHGSELAELLEGNGFTVPTITITEDQHVADRVRQEADAATSEVHASLNEVGAVLKQSLGIALMGINRGIFRDPNPIMTAMVEILGTKGIDAESARTVVSQAFAKSGDEFASVVRERTLNVFNKSDENRNELGALIGDVQVTAETAAFGGKSRIERYEDKLLETAKPSNVIALETAASKTDGGGSRVRELAKKSPLFASN